MNHERRRGSSSRASAHLRVRQCWQLLRCRYGHRLVQLLFLHQGQLSLELQLEDPLLFKEWLHKLVQIGRPGTRTRWLAVWLWPVNFYVHFFRHLVRLRRRDRLHGLQQLSRRAFSPFFNDAQPTAIMRVDT